MSRPSWTLRRKILLGQGVVLLLLAIISGVAFHRLERLGRASEAILRENYRSILAAENMIDALERQDSAMLLVALGHWDDGVSQFRTNEARFLAWYARARDNITIRGEDEILDRIGSSYRRYLESFDELRLRAADPGDQSDAFYGESILPVFHTVRDACTRLRQVNESAMLQASDRAEQVARSGVILLLIIGGSAVAFGVLFSLFLATLLVRPVRRLLEATQRIAHGDYDVEVLGSGSDELGRLSDEFNEMASQLRAYRDMNVERIVAEKQRSDAILQSIDDGLILLDDSLIVRRINPSAARAIGIHGEEVRDRPLLELVEDERFLEAVRGAAAGTAASYPRSSVADDILELHDQEVPRYFQYSVTPVALSSGARIGVVIVLRDVTKLRELDRLKSEFVMTASHELRTPLTSIEMSLDLLAENARDRLEPRERELLQAAHEDVDRLDRLVESLLDLTKIESGRIEMKFMTVSIAQLFEDVRSIFAVQFQDRGVALEVRPPSMGLACRADPEKIEWVLTNLLANALRYTDSGGRVEVSAERMGQWVSVSVGDTGAGIAPEYQSRIFDQFVQLDSQHGGGAGLGLALSREIVRAHGGAIWVDSEPGEGSLFTFALPAGGIEPGIREGGID